VKTCSRRSSWHQACRLPAGVGMGEAFTDLTVEAQGSAAPLNIHLKANNGQYVCANNGGCGTIVADRSFAAEWETFQLVNQNGPPLRSGHQGALRVNNGQFV